MGRYSQPCERVGTGERGTKEEEEDWKGGAVACDDEGAVIHWSNWEAYAVIEV